MLKPAYDVKNYVGFFMLALQVSRNGILFFERSSFIPAIFKFLLKN